MELEEFREKALEGVLAEAFDDWVITDGVKHVRKDGKLYVVRLCLLDRKLRLEVYDKRLKGGEDATKAARVSLGYEYGFLAPEEKDRALDLLFEFNRLFEEGVLLEKIAKAIDEGIYEDEKVKIVYLGAPSLEEVII